MLKYIASIFIKNGQGTSIRTIIGLRSEMSLRGNGKAYQAVVRLIFLCQYETWAIQAAEEKMLAAFDNDRLN